MRRLLLAAAFAAAAAPALAASEPKPIESDPMTVSGRFALPTAQGSAYAGKVRLGAVTVDPGFAARAKLDSDALQAAVSEAATRSLRNFGYLAPVDAPGAATVDLMIRAPELEPSAGASLARVTVTAKSADACLARQAEGRFRVLDRRRSGGGRRALAIGSAVALAFVGVNAGGYVGAEFAETSAENQALNAGRVAADGEGVAPGFDPASVARFGEMAALRLALVDYIGQLGAATACRPATAPPPTSTALATTAAAN